MLSMIIKMSSVTALYVLLSVLIWFKTKKKEITLPGKVLIGVIYGLCSVLSTHFGVNYNHMMLNVRDIGPLAAGLFFDPISGIIAGLIGGIERYIAGTYWGVGSYTRVACSISTCLAGFLSAALSVWLFKRRKPNVMYAMIMGAVMEVFHMYVVLITHREDMSMALYVVKTCSGPMIVFTGIGLAASSVLMMHFSGEWKNPFRRAGSEQKTVSEKFQFWQFVVTCSVLLFNLLFSSNLQRQSAIQTSRDVLLNSIEDISNTYTATLDTMNSLNAYPEDIAQAEVQAIAAVIESAGSPGSTSGAELKKLCSVFGFSGLYLTDSDGKTIRSYGQSRVSPQLAGTMQSGSAASLAVTDSDGTVNACARCFDGVLFVTTDQSNFTGMLDLSSINEVMSYFHVGKEGTFDILSRRETPLLGTHAGQTLSADDAELLRSAEMEQFFDAAVFGKSSLCRLVNLGDGISLLVTLPYTEVYEQRDAQMYELAFSDILLFAVIYVLISLLVQQIVVKNLSMVNVSLNKITGGDLNEVVDVQSSSEFASLSRDINMTVDTLKGYIEAAEKRIEQELEFARTIQESALPKNFTFPRSDFEIYATMDPAKEVGGDFYDFFFIDQNKLALVIADVSGKGIPAALFMMRAKTAVRGLAESGNSPGEILRRANATLSEGNDADMFVTVWLGIIDLLTGTLTCANAGHEYPVLMRAGGAFELYKDKHGLPLAAMPASKYREYELQLVPGDRLFVYTDGIPEAINEAEEQYGTSRLTETLNAIREKKMTEILPAVRSDIADFAGNAEQFDDITMLGFTLIGGEGSSKANDHMTENDAAS